MNVFLSASKHIIFHKRGFQQVFGMYSCRYKEQGKYSKERDVEVRFLNPPYVDAVINTIAYPFCYFPSRKGGTQKGAKYYFLFFPHKKLNYQSFF
jgi:hypothetical protein